MLKQLTLAAALLASTYAFAQDFEAASIKPVPENLPYTGPFFIGGRGGPGTDSAGRFQCSRCELSDLVSRAYDIPYYRMDSTKDLPKNRFDLVATIPPGTTQADFRIMLQHLLAERFAFKFHREQRPMRANRLLIVNGGIKLKPHVEGTTIAQPARSASVPGMTYRRATTMTNFAQFLEGQLKQPVVDATGLTGSYDIDLSWRFEGLDTGEKTPSDLPSLREALQSVGLKLDSHTEPVEVIVVDEVASTPTSN